MRNLDRFIPMPTWCNTVARRCDVCSNIAIMHVATDYIPAAQPVVWHRQLTLFAENDESQGKRQVYVPAKHGFCTLSVWHQQPARSRGADI